MHGPFDWFSSQVTVTCYMHDFFNAICMVFLIGCSGMPQLVAMRMVVLSVPCFQCYMHVFSICLATRPPLAAICMVIILVFVFSMLYAWPFDCLLGGLVV